MKRGPIALAASWFLLPFSCSIVAAAQVYPGWVIPETLIVRSGRGTDRRQIGAVHRGDKVYVTAFRDGWCWGKLPDGSWGWVMEKYLQFSADEGRKIAASAGKTDNGSSAGSSAETGKAAWIKASEARVRSGPGLDYRIYGTLPSGTKVYLLARRGDWGKFRTPGGQGWIHTSLLTDDVETGQRLAAGLGQPQPAAQPTTAKVFVDADTVLLRSGPGTRFDYRARLRKGQALYVFEKKGQWLKGRVHGGHTGWIAGWLVKYPDDGGTGAAGAMPPPPIENFPSPTVQYAGGITLSEVPAWVDENGARVRYGPGFDNEVRAELDRGTPVTVTDISGHWCKVRLPSGSYGWMAGWILDFDGPSGEIMADEGGQSVEVKVGWIARTRINLRSGPGEEHDLIGKATLSTQVVILDQDGDWYKVGLDGGREAWAASWLIDTREQRQARAARKQSMTGGPGGSGLGQYEAVGSGSGLGAQIVDEAMKLLGSPYSWGCSGERGSFDCSGLTSYLYRQHGISISRSVVAQYRQGTPVSRSELQPGDCVFFRNTHRAGISHVGIYRGDGTFVHASNPRSGVKIDSLDSSYYGPKYAGARRMR